MPCAQASSTKQSPQVHAWYGHFGKSAVLGLSLAVFTVLLGLQTGCNLASNLMHGLGVDMIPAEYEGLEDSTVAVVTLTDRTHYSNDAAARDLNQKLSEILTVEVDDVKLVREEKIDQWRDVHGWDAVDFAAIGKGVGAEKVLGIELADLKLRDGPTLYRGRCGVMVKVIDVATETVLYKRSIDDFTYPTLAGQDATGTTEPRFRRLYLTMLAQEIGRSFHPYDMTDRFALDSKFVGH